MNDNLNNVAEKIDNAKDKIIDLAKSKIFDLISGVLILAMLALSLGVIKLREVTWNTILDLLVEMIPFYLVAMMLSVTNYTKGSYAGKSTNAYKGIVNLYSEKVNKLTGAMLSRLPVFCSEYNEKALADRQTIILKKAAISYDKFNTGTENDPPLKVMSRKHLKEKYGAEIARVVTEAKNCSLRGINPNMLLGNADNPDPTNLGPNEIELTKMRTAWYAGGYIFSVICMTLIGMKDVAEWGWAGIVLVIFKLAWIGGSAYMKYFQGYKDVTIGVFNHLSRKCDIFAEFDFWYSSEVNSEKS